MDIAIIGAGGSVGMEMARLIVSERILLHDQRLVLTGNPAGLSGRSVYGFAEDLKDAYAEICPVIEVETDPAKIRADLIVMAAGSTLPGNHESEPTSRDMLAEQNAPVFYQYARAIARFGHGHEIVLSISNPNELCVAVFAKFLGRKRVIGIGAFLDSLRFRQEIAIDLGIKRQRIHGFMGGEHGLNLVPLWSGVHIYGYSKSELADALKKIRKGITLTHFGQAVQEAASRVKTLVNTGKVCEAYEIINDYPPDVRVVLKPFVTHFSGSKTVTGTARATLEFIRIITQGSDALISGQITLEGEFYGIHSTVGVPFVVGNQGVDRIFEIPVSDEEKEQLCINGIRIQEKLAPYLSNEM